MNESIPTSPKSVSKRISLDSSKSNKSNINLPRDNSIKSNLTSNSTSNITSNSNYVDASQDLSNTQETRDYIMARRIKDSEVIDNKSNLNPLQAPFAYLDGSLSLEEEIQVVASSFRNILHLNPKSVEDSGVVESKDKERMESIENKIQTLQNIENNNLTDYLHDLQHHHFSIPEEIKSVLSKSNENKVDSNSMLNKQIEQEKENKTMSLIQHDSEPIALPNRNATWQHSNNEQYYENQKLRLNNSNTLNSFDDAVSIRHFNLNNNNNNNNNSDDTNIIMKNSMYPSNLNNNDPKLILDKKNEKKTALMVDSFLLGYADLLFLTSSFFRDEYGLKKSPLIIPLLSICLTDITVEVFLSRKIKLGHDSNINSSLLNKDDLLRLATFTKNRIFRLHLEYGVGDHVLRWDLEKDTKALVVLHKKLLKRTKDKLDKAKIKDKDLNIPKFPVLPSHFTRFKGLFKGDKELLALNDNKLDHKKKPILSDTTSNFSGLNDTNKKLKIDNKKIEKSNGKSIDEKSNDEKFNNEKLNDEKAIHKNKDKLNEKPIDKILEKGKTDNTTDKPVDEINPATPKLERINSTNSADSRSESVRSLSHTLSRFSTAAIANLRAHNHKNKEKNKENDTKLEHETKKQREKENRREKERHLIALQERTRLNQKYRDDIQLYFDTLLGNISLREQSNKILQFFELSPFSLLLSNEIYRKRKEGFMFIVSSASKQGWRVGHFKFHDFSEMIKRHTSKWCILGDSFLMYTSDLTSTTPEEVFLIDSKTNIIIKGFSKNKSNRNGIGGSNSDLDSDSDNFYNYNINDNLNDNLNDNDEDDEYNDNDNDNNDEVDDYYFGNSHSVLKSAKSYPTIKLTNSERSIQLVAKNPRVTRQWASCIKSIINETEWSKPHRFNSFAPVRHHAFAQWFVDARDYWYAASSAIEMAKDVIYIHDWWLSPELYLRRPANGNQNWRIDRLLEKKAKQGVKIFVIIYRNVGNTVVTDSMYTKHSLLDLHENIYVLRSPNQIMQNVFFWAHHEKLLIIDHSVCFLGGIDLCFGRYDTPDHVLVDDSQYAFQSEKNNDNPSSSNTAVNTSSTLNNRRKSQTPETSVSHDTQPLSGTPNDSNLNSLEYDFQEQFQIFPGKDYSNPRKKDFFELTLPHDDMYDRKTVPRMPWHDVHMVTGGQVARDLSRHFIQRWNYLLRQKRPSRPTPLLVPPRPFTDEELTKLNLKGNCEVQLLRSSGDWSLGLKEHEQSIMNAYIKCIEQSEHFVYMENQFFVTSCTIESTVVKNQIGDALVDRIITAHKNGEIWKAVIVIPLMPGFEADVDTKEGGSVRLIMQCQYMSISMGESSIFARLRRVGIKPEDYINFYSLRKWGLISDKKLLTTEQLYIHAKTMIVDDRIAIIGSANINERSMRGTRDSEVCAIVRDKDLIESKMDGKPYHVGKFSHSLRVRLMREHLGVDVDLLDLVERRFSEIEKFCHTSAGVHSSVLRSNRGKPTLSAMVEMGTRYLLGLHGGTPGFCKRFGENSKYGEPLTKEMISSFVSIKTEGDGVSLDEIEFSFSFNHRAGNENAGIRSSKTLSSDTRVTNDNHRNEVKGALDGFNSKVYEEARIQFNKFLVQRVNQCRQELNDDDNFIKDKNYPLPDFEDIVDVLSQHVIENATFNEQNAINTDRWTMIKRLYYMKKLYCKMAAKARNKDNILSAEGLENFNENGELNTTISKVENNLRSVPSNFGNNKLSTPETSGSKLREAPFSKNNTPTSEGVNNINNNTSKKVRIPDIPLIKLKNDDINDIDKNMLPQIDFEFLDPYGFEDPLDISFYEGTWMAQAIRNSLLFQMVFHVQPDDLVQTWKDYKDFEELKTAHNIYQNIYRDEIALNENSSSGSNDFNGNGYNDEDDNDNDNDDNDDNDGNNDNYNNGNNSIDNSLDDDVVEHRRRLERSFKLAELERFQRISGTIGAAVPGASGYGRGAVYDYPTSLRLMHMVRGHVVIFPTRWLKKEVESSNWFYKADKIPPIQIYN